MLSIPASHYKKIFIEDRPLIDVRAPLEFAKGAFPHSYNYYLLQDDERALVGTCYKNQGQAAAIKLGHSLVCGDIKAQRIQRWLSHIARYPQSYLYCFRGGLRSQLSLEWLQQAGVQIPLIEGGYKALRQFLINNLEKAAQEQPLLILSGATGSGKTDLLSQRANGLDLESLAQHRGSSFGRYHEPQTSQINFENSLSIQLLKHAEKHSPYLLVEDESHLIGRVAIPRSLYKQMQAAPILVLEARIEQRINRIIQEYIIDMREGFIIRLGMAAGVKAFQAYLRRGIDKIRKRLGGKLHHELQTKLEQACYQQENRQEPEAHRAWIAPLLTQYYDPMYRYQLNKRSQQIIFRGDQHAIGQWLDQKDRCL